MSHCKCTKSDIKMKDHCPPYLENITTKMEERRCDLIGKERHLRDKITTLERSIPALMAYNMWMSGQQCEDAPYCKVREIMKRLSPYPDPTDKLLENLKKTVKDLDGETAELHEKIIDADVKLEETDMELESLELANKEMNDTVNDLEKEVRSYTTPSLHSINSEDLICLTKLRQLAKEEMNLKTYITDLEKKETIFRDQIDRLLMSKDRRSSCRRRTMKQICDSDCNEKKAHRNAHVHKSNIQKKKSGQKEDDTQSDAVASTSTRNLQNQQDQTVEEKNTETPNEKKSSWIPNWWKGNQKTGTESKTTQLSVHVIPGAGEKETPKPSDNSTAEQISSPEKSMPPKKTDNIKLSKCKPCGHPVCPPTRQAQHPHSCCGGQNSRTSGRYISTCHIPCKNLFTDLAMQKITRSRNPFCELPCIREVRKQRAPCSFTPPCEICPSTPCRECLPIRAVGNCRCNCRGKCARGVSDAVCNCSDEPLDPSDKGYQPTGSKSLGNDLCFDDSSSDDEFCECCSCGCEGSDASSSCNCN